MAVKERVLKLPLATAVEMLSTRKWNFYTIDRDRQIVKIEAPISSGESWVVEVPYDDQPGLTGILKELEERGFIEQMVRFVAE